MANPIINFFSRVFPGWINVKYTKMQTVEYFRQRNYYQANSIYLDNIINKIATDVAMLRFKHVKITRNDNAPDDMDWLESSDLSKCLTISPNDYETPFVFWSNVVRKMLRDGVAIVVPTYSGGLLSSLNLAEGSINYENHKVMIQLENETITVDINSVWIFENPKQNVSAGLGQITRLIDDSLAALSYKLSEQGQKLRGLLKIPTMVKDGSGKEYAEQRVNNILEMARGSGIAYLPQGEEFQELTNTYGTVSEVEMEFLKLQLYQAFGINEKLFTCDYSEEQYRAYFSSVLKVYQRVISEEINRKYFSKTARTQGQKLLVYFDMFDISSLKDLNEFAFKTKYSGIFNANEIREIFGYGSYAGGDVFETNKNSLQIQPDGSVSDAKMLSIKLG